MPAKDYIPILKVITKNPNTLKLFCKNPPTEFITALREIAFNILKLPLSPSQRRKIIPYIKQLKVLATKSLVLQKRAILKRYGVDIVKILIPIASEYIDG